MVEGKPMLTLVHSTVGLQHASMGIYNAYAGRNPVYIISGNTIDATMRRPGIEWYHSAQDVATIVRDYTKWDDQPISLAHFAESAVRAYKVSMTLPMMPVLLVVDSELQEAPVTNQAALRIPKLTLDSAPQGDTGSVAEAAKLLAGAENPVIIAGRVALYGTRQLRVWRNLPKPSKRRSSIREVTCPRATRSSRPAAAL